MTKKDGRMSDYKRLTIKDSRKLSLLCDNCIEQQKEEPYAWQVFHAKVDIFAAAGKDIFPKEDKEAAEARLKELQERRKDD